MKTLLLAIIALISMPLFADSLREKKHEEKNEKERGEKNHPKALSIFDVIPLNSPVRESTAKFSLKVPNGFDIDSVRYRVRNASRIFEKDQPYQKINLINGSQGKELHISVSKLPPGFYQLFVKVRDRKNKVHEFKTKFKDHAMFIVDNSLQVPMPNPKLNDKTVAGIDSDNDGIRDDIQRWINEEYASRPKVKMAMREIAMGRQLDLLSAGNKEQSIIVSKRVLDNDNCLYSILGIDAGAIIIRELKSKLLNTKDRLYAEIKANSNFSGQSYRLPRTPERKKALCAFNPDSL